MIAAIYNKLFGKVVLNMGLENFHGLPCPIVDITVKSYHEHFNLRIDVFSFLDLVKAALNEQMQGVPKNKFTMQMNDVTFTFHKWELRKFILEGGELARLILEEASAIQSSMGVNPLKETYDMLVAKREEMNAKENQQTLH